MTREETKKIIKVIQEYVDGGDIEFREKGDWFDADFPLWNFEKREYRIRKQKVKLYKYAYKNAGKWSETINFYTDDEHFKKYIFNNIFVKLKNNFIEVYE